MAVIDGSQYLVHFDRLRYFYVVDLSDEPSPPRNNTPEVLTSTERSGIHPRQAITISEVASLRPRLKTINCNSNGRTMPYGYGWQDPIFPRSPNDLNPAPKPFNILAAMAVKQPDPTINDVNYSPQSPELSDPWPISTTPMNPSTIEVWETPYTLTDNATFYSEDKLLNIFLVYVVKGDLPVGRGTTKDRATRMLPVYPTAPKAKKKAQQAEVLSIKKKVSQQVGVTCGKILPTGTVIPDPSSK